MATHSSMLAWRIPWQTTVHGVAKSLRLPFPFISPGIFLTRIKPTSLMSPALADGFFTTSANWEVARKEQKTPILVLAESKGQRFHLEE